MYKFKSANKNDIESLIQDKLWVPTLALLNDPMDLGFFIDDKRIPDDEILRFQDALNRSYVVISLGTNVQNRRLWNYYTDGMKGFVLNYRVNDLEKALVNKGASWPNIGKVLYSDEKQDLTEEFRQYLVKGKLPAVKKTHILFNKNSSWESEEEYRLITKADFLDNYEGAVKAGGICIENVVPIEIFIGYKMSDKNFEIIREYADSKGIEVMKFVPDFRNKNSDKFRSEPIGKEHMRS